MQFAPTRARATRVGIRTVLVALAGVALAVTTASAQGTAKGQVFPTDPMASVPKLPAIVAAKGSELAEVVERFTSDMGAVNRRYDGVDSPEQRQRVRAFTTAWRERLREIEFDKLTQEGRADYALLDNYLRYQQELAARREKNRGEMVPLLPFTDRLMSLHDARRNLNTVDPQAAARTVADVTRQVDSLRALFDAPAGRGGAAGAPAGTDSAPRPRVPAPQVSRTVANRAADQVDAVRNVVGQWFRFYNGYDPMFSWWVANPYQKLDESLQRYAQVIRQRIVGIPATTTVAAAGAPAAGGRGGAGGGGRGGGGGGDNTGPIIGADRVAVPRVETVRSVVVDAVERGDRSPDGSRVERPVGRAEVDPLVDAHARACDVEQDTTVGPADDPRCADTRGDPVLLERGVLVGLTAVGGRERFLDREAADGRGELPHLADLAARDGPVESHRVAETERFGDGGRVVGADHLQSLLGVRSRTDGAEHVESRRPPGVTG